MPDRDAARPPSCGTPFLQYGSALRVARHADLTLARPTNAHVAARSGSFRDHDIMLDPIDPRALRAFHGAADAAALAREYATSPLPARRRRRRLRRIARRAQAAWRAWRAAGRLDPG